MTMPQTTATKLPESADPAFFRGRDAMSMGSQLHRILRRAIIEGEFLPGQTISEIEMSKRYAISRQPVREAFIKLSEERLIEVRPQRGTYVRKIAVSEVLDARHLREIIEVSIVREVATRHDDNLLADLRNNLKHQSAVAPGDRRSFFELDEEFHRTLALHAGREYAWRVTESIKAQMNRVRFLALDIAMPATELLGEHTAIVDAIAAGDADLAARRMEAHLRGILSSIPHVEARYPEHFIKE